jgi:class 3 adenylate cyclase
LNPEKLSWLINSYLSEMSEIVFRFGGTLDKMIGDSIMVFFGDPDTRGRQRDAIACVCMAIAMRVSMRRLKTRWEKDGIKNPPSIRVGINSGDCRVGNFGTESLLDYTVVGSTVNLASHLESTAEADEILITEHTYKLVKNKVECTEKTLVNHMWLSKPLKLYSVQQIDKQNRFIQPSLPIGNP